MSNLLRNPRLATWHHERYFTDNTGNTGTIEEPDEWEFVYTPKHHDDPEKLPASLHRNELGFAISAGWRMWEGGYRQKGVNIKGNKRYRAVARFIPNVGFSGAVDLNAIQWRFVLEGGGTKIEQPWQGTQKGEFNQHEEFEFVFTATFDMAMDFSFMARSEWAGNSCNLNISEFIVEEVEPTYGPMNISVLGTGELPESANRKETPEELAEMPEPVPAPVVMQPVGQVQPVGQGGSASISYTPPAPVAPSTNIGAMSVPTIPTQQTTSNLQSPEVGTSRGLTLDDVLSDNDIDVIVTGLRQIPTITDNQAIIEAFDRLAEALELLK